MVVSVMRQKVGTAIVCAKSNLLEHTAWKRQNVRLYVMKQAY